MQLKIGPLINVLKNILIRVWYVGLFYDKNSEENLHVSHIVRTRNYRKITADYVDLDE